MSLKKLQSVVLRKRKKDDKLTFCDYNNLCLKHVKIKIIHREKWQNLFSPKIKWSKMSLLTLITFSNNYICLFFPLPRAVMLAFVSLCGGFL